MYHTETLRQLTEEPKSIVFLIVLCTMIAIAIASGFVFFNYRRPEFVFSKHQITGVAIVSYIVLFSGLMFHRNTVMEQNQDTTKHYIETLDSDRRTQFINQVNELPEGDYVKALVIQVAQSK